MAKMKVVAIKPFNNKVFYNNGLFNTHVSSERVVYAQLKKYLANLNFKLETIDLVKVSSYKDVHFDIPYFYWFKTWFYVLKNRSKSVLFLWEPPIVNPFNYMKIFHIFFSKVYTWHDGLVDNKKYHKFYFPNSDVGKQNKRIDFKDKKLICIINSNWFPFLPFRIISLSTKELYGERIKAISYFEKYIQDQFDLYGKGWDKPQRYNPFQKLFGHKTPKTYRGPVSTWDKIKTLARYKYCLCFENSIVPGYISEKIFDCFKAECVPVYWGAPNITDFIPKKCFIDYRDFKDYYNLVKYLESMDEATYKQYIKNIKFFLEQKSTKKVWFQFGFNKVFVEALRD